MKIPGLLEAREAIIEGRGEGVVIAILDSGVEESHSHFESCDFLTPLEVLNCGSGIGIRECAVSDGLGHGTAVAGIIHSLSPKARLLSVRVLGGEIQRQRHEAIRLGVRGALERDAVVLNCSFGVPGSLYSLPSYKSWADEAFLKDRHVVSASSNVDVDLPEWPAHLATTHSVTAGDYGAEDWVYLRGQPVVFGARGVDVEVPCPGGRYTCLTGSSFAAAHFSALLARLLSVYPGLSPSLAREIFRQLAKQ